MKPTFSLPPLSTYPSLSFSPSSNRRAFGGEERRRSVEEVRLEWCGWEADRRAMQVTFSNSTFISGIYKGGMW